MAYAFHADGSLPTAPDAIFVFGSNAPFGRHGRGAALIAMQRYGAGYGQGVGYVGRSYAIPTKTSATKTGPLTVLPLATIAGHVATFLDFARAHSGTPFFVTRVGCGLAGFRDADIAPFFAGAPDNCDFPVEWRPWVALASNSAKETA